MSKQMSEGDKIAEVLEWTGVAANTWQSAARRLADENERLRKRMESDRRELWWMESYLAVNGTNMGHHDRRLRLYRHLCATCEHDWQDVSGWGGCPKGTVQCHWCNAVALPGEQRPAIGSLSSIDEKWPRPDMVTPPAPTTDPRADTVRGALSVEEL